ncbi:hypothetical protein [Luteibacter sp. 22Crub2.1]|uniref:hypothetical protein n=1 Tax=Luteibacter sp. 22Crub2.1 TaxID=1283288 RepID=UPI0009D0E1FE|nr:hypothetical protein [Luteibacter sp. 22Crub2.1]SKC08469.1 hypothetical protein SAMN05660880_04114 [Luteibacter sp. 22Crub2.1]
MSFPPQKLLPATVPWQVSPSVPHLKLQVGHDRKPSSATFIGHFNDREHQLPSVPNSVPKRIGVPDAFTPEDGRTLGRFQMVRVSFLGGLDSRVCHAVSDIEVLSERDFDWSAVPGGLLPGEKVSDNVKRIDAQWRTTGICPDPGVYEVQHSIWLRELGLDRRSLRHIIILGHDDYLEIIADDWQWELGQSVD